MPESWGVTIASAFVVRDALPDKTFNTPSAYIPVRCTASCVRGVLAARICLVRRAQQVRQPLHFPRCSEGTGDDEALGPDVVPPIRLDAHEWPELFPIR